MPVLIDNIDTEIEIKSSSTRAQAMSSPAAQPGLAAPTSVPLREAVLDVLEAELDNYMRSRG
jgi:hypothetical protein